jgi:hypothetical protein
MSQAVEAYRVVRHKKIPHFLDSRLTDGSEVVSLICQHAIIYSQEDSWYSFLLEAESTPGL